MSINVLRMLWAIIALLQVVLLVIQAQTPGTNHKAMLARNFAMAFTVIAFGLSITILLVGNGLIWLGVVTIVFLIAQLIALYCKSAYSRR